MTEPVILIVDDDAILLESIADLLLLSDFRVVTAANGVEALRVLERERPDCVISDVMMPELDGFGLLEAIRAHEVWSSIPVILITAYDRPLTQRETRGITPDAVLAKPFDIEELMDVIHNSLA